MNIRPYPQKITMHAFDTACMNLARFMHRKAAEISKDIGISYVEVPAEQCPDNGKQIARKFAECRRECKPFPVYEGGSDDTIYGDKSANYAFRFWHDWLHAAHGCTTGLADELKLAAIHSREVAQVFGAGSLESRIMFADVAAQARYYFNTGAFVTNQRGFVYSVIAAGEY